jgi:hypothetical protein
VTLSLSGEKMNVSDVSVRFPVGAGRSPERRARHRMPPRYGRRRLQPRRDAVIGSPRPSAATLRPCALGRWCSSFPRQLGRRRRRSRLRRRQFPSPRTNSLRTPELVGRKCRCSTTPAPATRTPHDDQAGSRHISVHRPRATSAFQPRGSLPPVSPAPRPRPTAGGYSSRSFPGRVSQACSSRSRRASAPARLRTSTDGQSLRSARWT